ncbi:hypothetical protein NVP2275O_028 [Vibrio phage 2.275.O._10N.286.54.E11]|nr:hypothetical protein NVP2275O_028 [Vibrio phage 2.275.O._10N.286.54.E11]
MNTLKRDQFVLKVLAAKNISLDDAMAMDNAQLQDLKLSRVIVEAIEEYKASGGVTLNEVEDAIEEIRSTGTESKLNDTSIINEYNVDNNNESSEALETVSEPVIELSIEDTASVDDVATSIINDVIAVSTVSEDELKEIASKFDDKGVPSLTKKVKAEIGDKEVDLDVLREVVKSQVKVNKNK